MQPCQKEFWSLCAQCFVRPDPSQPDPQARPPDETDAQGTPPQCQIAPMAPHRVSYVEWGGRGDGRTLVCMHGVFRNSRDFDFLARHLANRGWRVVCPDLPGRGRSEDLPDAALYSFHQYLLDCIALLARLDVDRVSWLGTSLGGLIGMSLAAQNNSPIERLILNDIGTDPLSKAARNHIRTYAANAQPFGTLKDLEDHLRDIYKAFGNLTDFQWRYLAEHGNRWDKQGEKLFLDYDPVVGQRVLNDMAAFDQPGAEDGYRTTWQGIWDQVACPVLILNGADSLVLSEDTAKKMAEKDKVTLKRFAGCGHAPPLMNDEQIAKVRDWLEGPITKAT
jgi:pimeloyl-ACP methyl ester carboxylesterase